jgi:hypothetical protein
MAPAVSSELLIVEASVRARVNQKWICGEQSGNGTDFSSRSPVSLYQYHSIVALRIHVPSDGMNNTPVDGRSSENLSQHTDMNNNNNEVNLYSSRATQL